MSVATQLIILYVALAVLVVIAIALAFEIIRMRGDSEIRESTFTGLNRVHGETVARLQTDLTTARHRAWHAENTARQANEVARVAADNCQALVHEHGQLMDALEEAIGVVERHDSPTRPAWSANASMVTHWRQLLDACRAANVSSSSDTPPPMTVAQAEAHTAATANEVLP